MISHFLSFFKSFFPLIETYLQETSLYPAKNLYFFKQTDSHPARHVIVHKEILLPEVDLCPHPTDTFLLYCSFLQENFYRFFIFSRRFFCFC